MHEEGELLESFFPWIELGLNFCGASTLPSNRYSFEEETGRGREREGGKVGVWEGGERRRGREREGVGGDCGIKSATLGGGRF